MNKVLIGFFLGIIYCYLMYPKKEKSPTNYDFSIPYLIHKGSFVIPYSQNYAVHLHHWMLVVLILFGSQIILNKLNKSNKIYFESYVSSFLLILLFHGLSYKDCLSFIVKNPY